MKYVFDVGPKELPKAVYDWMIDQHKKDWTNVSISKNMETNRGVSVACDEGFDAEDIFPYRYGTGYAY